MVTSALETTASNLSSQSLEAKDNMKTLSKLFLLPVCKGGYTKRHEFAPFGVNSHLLEKTPFRRDLVCRETNSKSQKLGSLSNMAEKLPNVLLKIEHPHLFLSNTLVL